MNHSDESRLEDTQPSAARSCTQPAAAGEVYRRWLALTDREPFNPDAWIGLAEASADIQEKIISLDRALVIDPGNARARHALHGYMTQLLRRDPRLEYRGETHSEYRLRTAERFEFTHPKERAPVHMPIGDDQAQRRVYGWLKWALIGLIPAGLGTLFFAPVATLEAVMTLRRSLTDGERRRVLVAAVLATTLWLVALVPLVLLLLHLI